VSLAAPARAESEPRGRTLADRILASVPLLSVFFWVCVVYMWEAWRHGTPWLFGDELQLTQISRAIAETGHAARRGQPYSFHSLYTYFTAPAWLIDNVSHAYSAVKYMNVLAMTSAMFPTYGLARFVVGRRAALFAAAASVLIPSLAFTGSIVEENVAYPYAALCFFLIAGALIRRTRWWIAGAILASLVAPAVRGELAVIPALFVLAALFVAWQSPQVGRWRARWLRPDWIGFIVLAVGALVLVNAVMSNRSHEWLVATRLYKHRLFKYGTSAGGTTALEFGVFPMVAGLAALWRAPGEVYRRELRVFRSVALAGLVVFAWYTAVKGSYQSTVFGDYVVERNLFYVLPLLLVGTAIWLERRTVHPLAAVVAALVTLYLVLTPPYATLFPSYPYSQALGVSLLQWLNRSSLGLTPTGAKVLLALLVLASLIVLFAPRFFPRAGLTVALAAAAFALVCGGGGELAAASGSSTVSQSFLSNIHANPTWLDDHTHGAATLYLGQEIQDPNSENLLEFWNRSLKQVWSLDGTAPGPGPTLTPDVHGIHGVLYPDPHYPYLVAEPGIEPAGSIVATHEHRAGGGFERWTLYRVQEPLRLRYAVTGLFPDGWSGPNDTAYTRYSTAGGGAGRLRVRVSWEKWPGPNSARVTIYMGHLVIGSDRQPALGDVTEKRTFRIHAKQFRMFVLRAPGPQFRIEVHVDPKFMPAKFQPSGDRRELGAVVQYTFISPQHKRT
jgi:hypothetical protein